MMHVKPARPLAVHLDDLEFRSGIVFPIMFVLRLELHPQKSLALLVVPAGGCQFLGARAGVNLEEKRFISGSRRPESEVRWSGLKEAVHEPGQGRGGKTPCSAMQKFSVRYGIMLLCGKSPPTGAIALDDMATTGVVVV